MRYFYFLQLNDENCNGKLRQRVLKQEAFQGRVRRET